MAKRLSSIYRVKWKGDCAEGRTPLYRIVITHFAFVFVWKYLKYFSILKELKFNGNCKDFNSLLIGRKKYKIFRKLSLKLK